ncbi:MAG: BON domain-containing protein [Caulobacteraceae bacterium]
MPQDRWNEDRYGDEARWGDDRRPGRPRSQAAQDRGPEDYDRYRDDRPRWARDEETRYRPFGETGPISTHRGGYGGEGRSFGPSGRYDDLSPDYRAFEAQQQRIHRGDYQADRYTPNPREGRGEEPRSWWDRTQDELSSWFGDEEARRRREWDERRADIKAEHRGRGPKGYKRTDGRIEVDVNDRLTDDPYLDASDVGVTVKDSEVTLSGTVLRREDKRRAEDLAEQVSGVTHVQNNLRVKPRSEIPTTGDVVL